MMKHSNKSNGDDIAPPSTKMIAAVIGGGRISAEHLRFLRDAGHITLAGVCDLSPALGEFAVRRYGAKRAFTDYRVMLEEVKPDVVHILTPPHTHVALARDCLQAGAHVIVEKPITPTHAEFQDLWAFAQECGRSLIEDHNYRFCRRMLDIEQMVSAGRLGAIREVEVRMVLGIAEPGGRYADANMPHPSHKLPAGVLQEFLPHLCYLALRFLPSFERVAAAWSKHGKAEVMTHDDLDAIVIGGGVHARLRFSSNQGPDSFLVRVRGSRGWAETDFFCPYLRFVGPRAGPPQLAGVANLVANGLSMTCSGFASFRDKILQRGAYEGLYTFLDRTYTSLRGGTEPPVTFDDMDRCSRLVEALLDEGSRV